jgi:hypothetical protein
MWTTISVGISLIRRRIEHTQTKKKGKKKGARKNRKNADDFNVQQKQREQ